MRVVDLVGYRKGKITVIKRVGTKVRGKKSIKKEAAWLCKCDCGKEIVLTTNKLLHENCNSCGCYRVEFMLNIREEGTLKGISKNHWKQLIKKCTDSNDRRYFLYGGRGITICDEWLDFEKFYSWIKTQTSNPNYTIQLKDKKGIYEPDNCFLAPKMAKIEKGKGNRNHKYCYLSEKEWEEIARGAATMVLKEEELNDYFEKHDPFPYVFPEYASKLVEMSVETFKKYARQYLMPEIYGDLPDDFFKTKEDKYMRMKKLPRLE